VGRPKESGDSNLVAFRAKAVLALKVAVFLGFAGSSSACIGLLGVLFGTSLVLLSCLPLAVLLTQVKSMKYRTEQRFGAKDVLQGSAGSKRLEPAKRIQFVS
jgi:hypothetical protein